MPKKVIVPEDELKACALATSLADCARHYGYALSTIRSIARRKGWKTPARLAKASAYVDEGKADIKTALRTMHRTESAGDALERHLEASGRTFRSGLASGLASAADSLSSMSGDEVLAASKHVANIAGAGKVIFGLTSGETNSAVLNVNLLSMNLDDIPRHVRSDLPVLTLAN